MGMALWTGRRRRARRSLSRGTEHEAQVSSGRSKKWACPPGQPTHVGYFRSGGPYPLGMSIAQRGQ